MDIDVNYYLAGKKVALITLGCKVNSYETDAIREKFEAAGAVCTDETDSADIFVVNTCSVTNMADRKSRQMLHRVRTANPGALVIATGCYAQASADELIKNNDADIAVGNNQKIEVVKRAAEYFMILQRKGAEHDETLQECHEALTGHESVDGVASDETASDEEKMKPRIFVDALTHEKEYEEMSISDFSERTRAFIKVEDGCNQFCSYCIIPYTRGRVRSRSVQSVVDEVKRLAANGFKEVVLTGIHLSSFGMSDYDHAGSGSEFRYEPLLELIQEVAEVDGIERVRLGSLEPRIICTEFAEKLAAIPQFCPHFHLSLQSGSNSVLSRMNRKYTAAEFLDRCDILRKVFDRPAITTDVIVGFPQESDDEFAESKMFLERAAFAKMHIFKYSRRKGTRADRMGGQVPEQVKTDRSGRLIGLDKRMHLNYISSFVGEEEKILVESCSIIDGVRCFTGLTSRYVEVIVPADEEMEFNKIANVRITAAGPDGMLRGEFIR